MKRIFTITLFLTCLGLAGCAGNNQKPHQTISVRTPSGGADVYDVTGSRPISSPAKQTVAESYEYIQEGMRTKCPNGISIKTLNEQTVVDEVGKKNLSWKAVVTCKAVKGGN